MKKQLFMILTMFILTACSQVEIKTPNNAMKKFEEFNKKEKFNIDTTIFYPGIADASLIPVLTEKINQVAKDFSAVSVKEHPTEKDYQEVIEKGLERFRDVYIFLDTEDRERVCHYFEELMDIVGLNNSDGQLNNFMYGFEPNKTK